MSSTTVDLNDKIKLIKKRREYLESRIINSNGPANAWDVAEHSLMRFMAEVIEENYDFFYDELDKYRTVYSKKS